MKAYLDANLFVHASASKDVIGESCVKVLDWLAKGKITGVTSFLTFDEVFYKLDKLCGFENAAIFTENFLTLPNLTFVDVNSAVIFAAFKIIKENKFHPRDAIHAATALLHRANILVTEDKNLLGLPWLESITVSGFIKQIESSSLTGSSFKNR